MWSGPRTIPAQVRWHVRFRPCNRLLDVNPALRGIISRIPLPLFFSFERIPVHLLFVLQSLPKYFHPLGFLFVRK